MGSLGGAPSGAFSGIENQPGYEILEKPSRAGRKIKIICLGGGASAINLAHEVSTSDLDLELVCYEKHPSVGGSWYENRYPGCGCDIPSVNYQYSWAPSPEWTSLYVDKMNSDLNLFPFLTVILSYSGAPEILAYFKNVAKKHNLMKYIKLNHKVVGAFWDEDQRMWNVRIQRGDDSDGIFEDKAHIFINASGVLKCVLISSSTPSLAD